jgi:molecular chaperone HtpG
MKTSAKTTTSSAKPSESTTPSMKTVVEQFEYKAEMKQLLHLIVHSLYTHPEVFIRELVSNASDALNKVRYRQLSGEPTLETDQEHRIAITLDSKQHRFTIDDNGIGMTREDLITRLGTVASSGTLEFLKSIKEAQEAGTLSSFDASMIGQFGVGFYSAFMVADEVTVETRHAAPDSVGLRWKSDGQGTFTIEEIEKSTRGTTISFVLKDSAKEFGSEYRVRSIIAKYSNFVDFPIYLAAVSGDDATAATPERINSVKALWQLPKDQVSDDERTEFYKFLTGDIHEPLGHIHLSIEGTVNFKALLFVPASSPFGMTRLMPSEQDKSVHLYSNKILIQENCKELLPEYLRFVRGVVDTEDLPLNVSREATQSSPVMAKISKILTGKILALLQEWAAEHPAKYEQFYRSFGTMLKLGINADYTNREVLISLLRFESSMKPKGELISFKDYAARMKSEQTEIYYLAGEHRDVMLSNPNLEYFQKHSIEVLLLTEPVDVVVVPSILTAEGKPLKSIDKADVNALHNISADAASPDDNTSSSADENQQNLLKAMKSILADAVEDVVASRRLVDSAATLVVGKEGMDVQMEKMMKALDRDFKGSRKILEVNMEHPLLKHLVQRYAEQPDSPLLRQHTLHLYEGALLVEGNLATPTLFVRRMWEIMTDAAANAARA